MPRSWSRATRRGRQPGNFARRVAGGAAGRRLWAALGIVVLALGGCAGSKPPTEDFSQLVWPSPPEPPRIKLIRVVRSEDDARVIDSGEQLKSMLLGAAPRGLPFKKPYGVHADREGRLFVTDTGWGKVLMFDFQRNKFAVWGTEGQGLLGQPFGIDSDSAGRIYVTDNATDRVVVFDRDGNFVLAMGRKGELEQPVGIAVNDELGRVYVVDVKKHHIAVFDLEGTLLTTIGERGAAPGQFNFPTNLAIGPGGKLYVMDTMNFRVQVMGPDGNVITTVGEIGDGFGQFTRPKGIGVDSDGNIYVADAAFNNYQIFDPEGRLLLFVGQLGQRPGQFWLPAGLYVDGHDRIYVVDQYNFRIQMFERIKTQASGGPGSPQAFDTTKVALQRENWYSAKN